MSDHSVYVMEVFQVNLLYVNVISTFCKGSQQMAVYSSLLCCIILAPGSRSTIWLPQVAGYYCCQ